MTIDPVADAIHNARNLAATPAYELDDPFATPEDTRQAKQDSVITGGRYRLPSFDGSHRTGGWQRATNLASAISDQRALQDWTVTTTLAGLASRPDLYDGLQALIARTGATPAEVKAARDEILALAERAKDAAGGGDGREHGNRVHAIVEAEWVGHPVHLRDGERRLLDRIAKALAESWLQPIPGMQERIVAHDELDTCGKLDSLFRDLLTDLIHVGDTKSQRAFWTWLEVEAQLAFYAHAERMWDAAEGVWTDMPKVDGSRGFALWVPRDQPDTVEIKPLDLDRGWRTIRLARQVVTQRSACKSTRQDVCGRTWAEVRPVAPMERYAALLRTVGTREDGSRVVAEAQAAGVWGPELEQVAREVARAL